MTPEFPEFPQDAPWDVLTLYVAGEASAQERGEVERWIATDAKHAELVAELRAVWGEAPKLKRQWNADAALEQIKRRPSGPTRVIHLPKFYRGHPMSRRLRLVQGAVAAAGAMAAVAAVAIFALGLGRDPKPQALPPAFEVSTTLGQRASVNLSDGSRVTLGPMSSISYQMQPSGARTVRLVGQALFTVTHDSTRPFSVHTTHGVATDLGTRFVVRSYPSDSSVVVAVLEGEVALAAPASSASIVLRPRDRGEARSNGSLAVEHSVDVDRHLAWTDGRLEFRYTPMRDVVAELGRWYDLEIRLASEAIADRRLSASFRDESVDEVLRLIRASLDVRVERVGRVVTITSR